MAQQGKRVLWEIRRAGSKQVVCVSLASPGVSDTGLPRWCESPTQTGWSGTHKRKSD